MNALEIRLRTLTPLWTGGVDQTIDRLHETGLIGSLRWWYEALVRGLDGHACDPASDDRCPDEHGRRCAACELFGCTGWARKFRLRVSDKAGHRSQAGFERGTDFKLQFLELRPMNSEEKWLLVKAIEIAAKYGALGGKTTLKPQKKPKVGSDYGVVEWRSSPTLKKPDIKKYLHSSNWRQAQTKLPDMKYFFFVCGRFLWRKQINKLLGLSEDGKQVIGQEEFQKFLRGRRGETDRPAISKKLFSFRADNGRVWGYTGDIAMRDRVIKEIRKELGEGNFVKTGEEVLNEL